MTDTEFDRVFKIRNTKYDRHKKITQEMADRMYLLRFKYKWTFKEIAEEFNCSPTCVRYNIDNDFRSRVLEMTGPHTGHVTTLKERVAYKKSILKNLLEDGIIDEVLRRSDCNAD